MQKNGVKYARKWVFRVKKIVVVALVLSSLLEATISVGQISPPGLDGARMVTWAAVGINQKLTKKISTTVYIGGSEQSDPVNYSAIKKPAILVFNQETFYQFNPHWQTSIAVSYRFQDLYEEDAPYSAEDPPYRKELRFYSRLFYKHGQRTVWTYTFRPEYRLFYAPDGDPWPTPVQMRFRLKAQVVIPVNTAKTNQVILANDWLTATNKNSQSQWSSLEFTEDRLSTYFRHTFQKPAVFLDIGFMHQLRKNADRNFEYTIYLCADLIFQNPFGK